jgi:hypothetical protein
MSTQPCLNHSLTHSSLTLNQIQTTRITEQFLSTYRELISQIVKSQLVSSLASFTSYHSSLAPRQVIQYLTYSKSKSQGTHHKGNGPKLRPKLLVNSIILPETFSPHSCFLHKNNYPDLLSSEPNEP